jgi:hypothetical protein
MGGQVAFGAKGEPFAQGARATTKFDPFPDDDFFGLDFRQPLLEFRVLLDEPDVAFQHFRVI